MTGGEGERRARRGEEPGRRRGEERQTRKEARRGEADQEGDEERRGARKEARRGEETNQEVNEERRNGPGRRRREERRGVEARKEGVKDSQTKDSSRRFPTDPGKAWGGARLPWPPSSKGSFRR